MADEFTAFSLILMRFTGFIFFSPVFGHRNIPIIVKNGMALISTILLFPVLKGSVTGLGEVTSLVLGVSLMRELLAGMVVGYVMNLFFAALSYAGSIIDYDMGFSMASVYDPQTQMSVSINGSLMQFFMIALFFATDCHIQFFSMMAASSKMIPFGQPVQVVRAAEAVLAIFVQSMELALKLAFPMIAIQLMVQAAVGVLMRMIPQIDIFAVNVQLKILCGLAVLLFIISPLGSELEKLFVMMFQDVGQILTIL